MYPKEPVKNDISHLSFHFVQTSQAVSTHRTTYMINLDIHPSIPTPCQKFEHLLGS